MLAQNIPVAVWSELILFYNIFAEIKDQQS
jgi:dsDNA-specific endonuclease/ATPase MutS2